MTSGQFLHDPVDRSTDQSNLNQPIVIAGPLTLNDDVLVNDSGS